LFQWCTLFHTLCPFFHSLQWKRQLHAFMKQQRLRQQLSIRKNCLFHFLVATIGAPTKSRFQVTLTTRLSFRETIVKKTKCNIWLSQQHDGSRLE
jgi:hypothetical protein